MTLLFASASGRQYRDWRDVLCPPGLPMRLWLERYAAGFAAVEVDTVFAGAAGSAVSRVPERLPAS